MDMAKNIEYKGYKIWDDTDSTYHHNKVSGHNWVESAKTGKYYIVGKHCRVLDTYNSIAEAKEHIDFIITTY